MEHPLAIPVATIIDYCKLITITKPNNVWVDYCYRFTYTCRPHYRIRSNHSLRSSDIQ